MGAVTSVDVLPYWSWATTNRCVHTPPSATPGSLPSAAVQLSPFPSNTLNQRIAAISVFPESLECVVYVLDVSDVILFRFAAGWRRIRRIGRLKKNRPILYTGCCSMAKTVLCFWRHVPLATICKWAWGHKATRQANTALYSTRCYVVRLWRPTIDIRNSLLRITAFYEIFGKR